MISIDIVDLLGWLGVKEVQREGAEVYYQCPFPGHKAGSSNRNASFRESREHGWWLFNCFVCGAHGTAIEFYSKHQGVHRELAKMAIKERYGSRFIDPGDNALDEVLRLIGNEEQRRPLGGDAERHRPIVPLPEPILEGWATDWEAVWSEYIGPDADEIPEAFTYMFRRGFTVQTLTEWEIGFDPITGMITIPYRDAEGRFIAAKGRAWWANARPKYKMLGNKEGREDRYSFDTIDISQVLYGLWKLPEGNSVILCEGELNCMAMTQYGHRRVLGLSGQFLSEAQAKILSAVADEAVLLFDDEERALAASDLLLDMYVRIIPERDTDPADASDEEVAAWLDQAVSPFELEYED